MIIFIYVLHQNLSAKTYADEPTFALLRLLRLGGLTQKTVMRPAGLVSVCVCVTCVCVFAQLRPSASPHGCHNGHRS